MADYERVELAAGFPNRGSLRGRACVAADHSLASAAGHRMLLAGGSAADAAIAMGAVMTVVQPHYSQLGGDGFAVTYSSSDRSVRALNSSGPAPRALDAASYGQQGIPGSGARAVTVPGCVGGWWALHQDTGRLPWNAVLTPAIEAAQYGVPASRGLARAVSWWPERGVPDAYFDTTFGHVRYDTGAMVYQPALAGTLEAIAERGPDGFYGGSVRDACIETLRAGGADFDVADWVSPARWETPLAVPFAGSTVHMQPPPSRGLVLALALQNYEGRAGAGDGGPATQFETLEGAFAAVNAFAGDPDTTGFDAQAFLATPRQPERVAAGPASDGDTTYLLAVDGDGNAVSWIQSVFSPWGSAVWAPETGILMNNRMNGFVTDEGHANAVAPGKRPMHTLHCYLATGADGSLRLVGGAPGAHRQPTTNLQVLDAVLRDGLDIQDALDLPRWSVGSPGEAANTVELEIREGDIRQETFEAAGLRVEAVHGWHGKMGRAAAALMTDDGVHVAGDLRGEGVALAV